MARVVLYSEPVREVSAAVLGLCGWPRGQMSSRAICLTPPRIFSPQHHRLLISSVRCEALSSHARPTTALSKGDEHEAVEERQAAKKREHAEWHGDKLFEQEADGPTLHDQALAAPGGSCREQELLWTNEHDVDSSARGTEAEAPEVASIMEELRSLYPKRRSIPPATVPFVGALLGVGLTKPQVCRMFAQNSSLFARSSGAFRKQRELLERHGVGAAGFRALLQRGTWWLSRPLQEVEGNILYVERLLGGAGEAAARVLAASPQLLSCSIANQEEKVQALQREGVRDVARVITKYPHVLNYTAQDIVRKAAALKGALGPELAEEMLERYPRVLRVNAGVLRGQLAWLEKTFGRAAALRMVAKQPSVLGAKVETASAAYAGLVGTFGEARARRMLVVQSTLLQCKRGLLEAKVDFVTKELGHTLDEIASWPTVLGFSLEGRMQPRAAALQAAGKAYGTLISLLLPPDKKFEQRFGVRLRRVGAESSEAEAPQGRREGGVPRL